MYEYQPVNPLQGFAQGLQFVQGLQQQRQQQQQQIDETEQKARRQIDLQRAVQNLRVNPSPEAMAEFGLQFPEMKEQLEGYFKTLDAGKKSTQVAAARDVIIAQRGGGNVQEVFERYATAAENSRDPEMAKIFRDAAEVAKTDPAAAAETARIHLAFGDKDVYDRLYRSTAAIDNYEYFKEVLGPGKVEEIIGITPKDGVQVLPNGMVIAGPDSPLARSMSGGSVGGAAAPTVSTKQEVEALPPGASFVWGPTGKAMTKQGGGSSNATGGFRGP